MNGNSSKVTGPGAYTFHTIQTVTKTVIPIRNAAVPMKRANASANSPKVSPLNRSRGSRDRLRRPGTSSRAACWSRSSRAMGHLLRVGLVELHVTPVLGEDVVEHVVDGDRADQPLVLVDDRGGHQV